MTAQRQERKERIPVNGMKDKLTVRNKDPKLEYRWVLDTPGRIQKFQDGGWTVVQEDLEIGQKTVDRESKVGSAITKFAGGLSTYVLMSIPKEWYDEDQKAKQDAVDALEASMNEDLRHGRFPGTGSQERGSYVPEGGGLVKSVTRTR